MTKPRLLTKRELDVAKSQDRANELREGKKLADRVDGLRELAADTEKELQERKEKLLKSIQGEVNAKIAVRDSLDTEIAERKTKLEELRKPLDAEWEQIGQIRNDLHVETLQLEEREMNLKSGIALNIQRERDNEEEHKKLQHEKDLAQKDRLDADALKEDAAKRLLSARSEADKIVSRAKEREEAVAAREDVLDSREESMKSREKHAAEMLAQAKKEFAKVRDLYATLERNKKRGII